MLLRPGSVGPRRSFFPSCPERAPGLSHRAPHLPLPRGQTAWPGHQPSFPMQSGQQSSLYPSSCNLRNTLLLSCRVAGLLERPLSSMLTLQSASPWNLGCPLCLSTRHGATCGTGTNLPRGRVPSSRSGAAQAKSSLGPWAPVGRGLAGGELELAALVLLPVAPA